MVEFEKDKANYYVVYTSEGKKVLVRRSLNSIPPKAVLTGISNTRYKNWKIGKNKEEIFKNEGNASVVIYKITMLNGLEKHILYFRQDGQLMKDIEQK